MGNSCAKKPLTDTIPSRNKNTYIKNLGAKS